MRVSTLECEMELLKAQAARVPELQEEIERRTAWAWDLEAQMHARTEWALQRERDLAERTGWALQLRRDLDAQVAHTERLERECLKVPPWVKKLAERMPGAFRQRPNARGSEV
jgi:hypothetical protein